MTSTVGRAWPLALVAMRSTALIAVTLALLFVVLPAVLAAAGPQVPSAG